MIHRTILLLVAFGSFLHGGEPIGEYIYIANPGENRLLLCKGTLCQFGFSKQSDRKALWSLNNISWEALCEYMHINHRIFIVGSYDEERREFKLIDWYVLVPQELKDVKKFAERSFCRANVEWMADLYGFADAGMPPENYSFLQHVRTVRKVLDTKN